MRAFGVAASPRDAHGPAPHVAPIQLCHGVLSRLALHKLHMEERDSKQCLIVKTSTAQVPAHCTGQRVVVNNLNTATKGLCSTPGILDQVQANPGAARAHRD